MRCFDHEKRKVYAEAIAFNAWVGDMLEGLTCRLAAKDQLDRAATSIPLNIAEGHGKFSARDRRRYLETANGSAVECAACLDVMQARGKLAETKADEGKAVLREIVSMLIGLMASIEGRVEEEGEGEEYRVGGEGESRSKSKSRSRRGAA